MLPTAKSISASRFISEIITRRLEVVGPLPESISTPTRLAGFIGAKAKDQAAAKELLKLSSRVPMPRRSTRSAEWWPAVEFT